MTAITFNLRELATGRPVAQAVLCAEARYCSVLWSHHAMPARRFATPAEWRAIEHQVADTLEAGPLDRNSPIVRVLVGDHSVALTVQDVAQQPIDVRPEQTAAELDRVLGALTGLR